MTDDGRAVHPKPNVHEPLLGRAVVEHDVAITPLPITRPDAQTCHVVASNPQELTNRRLDGGPRCARADLAGKLTVTFESLGEPDELLSNCGCVPEP